MKEELSGESSSPISMEKVHSHSVLLNAQCGSISVLLSAVLFQFCMVVNPFFFTSGDYICSLLGIFSDAFFFILASIVLSVNIGGWLQLNHFSTTLYCPLAIIKKLLQLILHFHWLRRSPLQRIDIFWYSPSSRKMVTLFVNISKRE